MKIVTEILILILAISLDSIRAAIPGFGEKGKDGQPSKGSLPKFFDPDSHNRVIIPVKDPPEGSPVYVQVRGGRVLRGVLDNRVSDGPDPQEIFALKRTSNRRFHADLHTIQNINNPEVQGYRCFIPIRRNHALAATLEYHNPRDQLDAITNVLAIVQRPENAVLKGTLHVTNGRIPAWLDGLVRRPD